MRWMNESQHNELTFHLLRLPSPPYVSMKDTVLAMDLISKLQLLVNVAELCRVIGTNLHKTLHSGQSIKVQTKVLYKTSKSG